MRQIRFTNHLSRLGEPPAGQGSFEGVSPNKIGGGEAKFTKAQLGQNIIVVRPGEDIQNAINQIHDTNGGRVFLRNGEHYVNNDLIMYSNITLEGEGIYSTIIDFGSQAHSLRIEGNDAYDTGTVSVTQGGTIVTGSGTAWTEDMVGQSIALDGDYYDISAVNSATELVIETAFAGLTQVGLTYFIATVTEGVGMKSLTIQNSSTYLVKINYSYFVRFDLVSLVGGDRGLEIKNSITSEAFDWEVYDCNIGVYLENCWAYTFETFYIFNCVGNGVELITGGDATLYNFGVSKCAVGMQLTDTEGLALVSFTVDSNSSHGIEFVSGCGDNNFEGGWIKDNGGEGIKLTSTSDANVFISNQIRDNSLCGVNIAAADCDNNIILGNIFSGNDSGQVSDIGTGTLIRSNVGVADYYAGSISPSRSPSVSVSRSPSVSPSAS